MNAINQIIIEGNVVRSPEVKTLPKGTKGSTLPIAVNHVYKDESGKFVTDTGYYNVEAWGEKFSDRVSTFGVQGRGVRVIGRLKQNRWKDENGKNHERVLIVAEHVDFKPFKKKDDTNGKETELKQETVTQEANLALAAQGVAQEADAVF